MLEGLKPDRVKIRAIQELPVPADPTAVRSFFLPGKLYGKVRTESDGYCSILSELIAKDEWKWNKECDRTMQEVKHAILNTAGC